MRKRSARKRRAEAGPPLVPDPREEIGGEEVDVGMLGLGFVGAGFAGIREIGVGVRTAEGESAIEHRHRVGPMYIAQVASNGRVLTWGAKVSYSET
uniref:Uncharacterized protein n=1 Tax=Brassica campestris TaxID=3711 RepID=M4DMZ3_BRACM